MTNPLAPNPQPHNHPLNLIAPPPNLNTPTHSRPFHDLTPDDRDLNFDASAHNPENPHFSFGDLTLNPNFRHCAPDAPARNPGDRGLNFDAPANNLEDRHFSLGDPTLNLNLRDRDPDAPAAISRTATSASATPLSTASFGTTTSTLRHTSLATVASTSMSQPVTPRTATSASVTPLSTSGTATPTPRHTSPAATSTSMSQPATPRTATSASPSRPSTPQPQSSGAQPRRLNNPNHRDLSLGSPTHCPNFRVLADADPALNSDVRDLSVDNLNFLHRILTDGAFNPAGRDLDNPNFRAQNRIHRIHNPTRRPSTSPIPPTTPMTMTSTPPKAPTPRRPHPLLLVSGP